MQKNRMEVLSRPKKWVDVVSIFERTLPAPVSKAAMQCQLDKTSRIVELSKPKKREANPELHQPIKTHFNVDRNPAKYDGVSMRIIKLAIPKPEQRKLHETCTIHETQKSYLRSYDKQVAWLKQRAAPKRLFRPKVVSKKYTKLSKIEMEDFYERLSTVPESKRYKVIKKEPKPIIKKLPKSMLESVDRLSEPRKIASAARLDMEFNPFEIPERVLRYKATPLVLKLAEPKVYETSAIKDAIRENPFDVSKSSLKYKATKRIKKLAQPRRYDF